MTQAFDQVGAHDGRFDQPVRIGTSHPVAPLRTVLRWTSRGRPPFELQEAIMCLAEPGRVVSIEGVTARVATIGGPIDVSLAMLGPRLDDVERGDWVVVSAGLVLLVIPDANVPTLCNERRFLSEVPDAVLEPTGSSMARVPTETSRS